MYKFSSNTLETKGPDASARFVGRVSKDEENANKKIIFASFWQMRNFSGAKLIEIIDSRDKIWSPHYRNKLVTEIKNTLVQGSIECKQNDCVRRPANNIQYS